MLDSNFIDFNSPDSTVSYYEVQAEEPPRDTTDLMNIDLQDFSKFTVVPRTPDSEIYLSDLEVRLDKICSDRVRLFAKTYSENQVGNHEKEMLARIQMIEEELDNTAPRYGEAEWRLLESFKNAIDAL